ncbi:hypothetical protein [Marinovum algicola]|uniref:hypothetical protein n=1 Tax=Marinovum algicola TaxID=42444 RepID=UPI003B51A6F0
MKTLASILCLTFVCVTLFHVGERSLFFSDYPMFVAIFAALALLVSVTAIWVGATGASDDEADDLKGADNT